MQKVELRVNTRFSSKLDEAKERLSQVEYESTEKTDQNRE
jgi:hypothetical protein